MDHQQFQKFRLQYFRTAYQNSDHSPRGIYTALTEIAPPGRFTFHREEKTRALRELREELEGRRHWPLEIVLSQMGFEKSELD
jgi:hypothetical protein